MVAELLVGQKGPDFPSDRVAHVVTTPKRRYYCSFSKCKLTPNAFVSLKNHLHASLGCNAARVFQALSGKGRRERGERGWELKQKPGEFLLRISSDTKSSLLFLC